MVRARKEIVKRLYFHTKRDWKEEKERREEDGEVECPASISKNGREKEKMKKTTEKTRRPVEGQDGGAILSWKARSGNR